jgi:hypothetical protein
MGQILPKMPKRGGSTIVGLGEVVELLNVRNLGAVATLVG